MSLPMSDLPGWVPPVSPMNWPRTDEHHPAYLHVLDDIAPAASAETVDPPGPSWEPRDVGDAS